MTILGLSVEWSVMIGISSVVIASCALIFSIKQFSLARKHNRLSFRPHLSTWTHRDVDKGFYHIELVNNGLGPAVIESFLVKIDGKGISGEGTEPIEKGLKILFPNLAYKSNQSFVAEGYSMAAKERCTIVAIQFTGPQLPSGEFIEHAFNRGSLEISYKSFYEEPFHLSTDDEKANKPLQSKR